MSGSEQTRPDAPDLTAAQRKAAFDKLMSYAVPSLVAYVERKKEQDATSKMSSPMPPEKALGF